MSSSRSVAKRQPRSAPHERALAPLSRTHLARAEHPATDILRAWHAGKSPDTLAAYRSTFTLLATYLELQKVPMPGDPISALVALGQGPANLLALRWMEWLTQRGMQPQSIKTRLSHVRSAIKLMRTTGITAVVIDVASPKAQGRSLLAEGSRFKELRTKFAETAARLETSVDEETSDWVQMRDLTIVRLARSNGLRRLELHRLDVADFDVRREQLMIHGKGRAKREPVALAKATVELLKRWLKIHPVGAGPLFPSTKGGRLSRNGISKLFDRRDAGKPHDMRRLAITTLLQKTGDPLKTKAFSRHASITTVELYDVRGADDFADLAELAAEE